MHPRQTSLTRTQSSKTSSLQRRNPTSPRRKKQKETPKPDPKDQCSDTVAGAPGAAKGNAKTVKGKAFFGQRRESSKPRVYFAYDACTRGDQCPHVHDPNNKYKGPEPKGLTTDHFCRRTGVAKLVTSAVAASSSVKRAKGHDARVHR